MPSEQVLVSIVSGISGVVIAYITTVLANKYKTKKAERQPKDRMEQMFDGYERLISQKDIEDQRKARVINQLQKDISRLEDDLRLTRVKLDETQGELMHSNDEKIELKNMLHELRDEYRRFKQDNIAKNL